MRAGRLRHLVVVAALLTLAVPAPAAELAGRAVSITDGDTLDILTADKTTVRIRLAEIDAPERRQPFGTVAKQALSDLAFEKQVSVEVVDHDRWGRSVGIVRVGRIDVNAEMVRRGMAWVYRKYSHRPALIELESDARGAKRGLWADAHPMAPWGWRARQRASH